MPKYATDPLWADITPLPPTEGGPNPLAAIAYSDDYTELMAYLRAVMARNEHSARVLALTEDLIDLNPAHYTVWLYRAATLFALGRDGSGEGSGEGELLREELEWLDEVALAHQKNYQIWQHRNLVVSRLCEVEGRGGEGEEVGRGRQAVGGGVGSEGGDEEDGEGEGEGEEEEAGRQPLWKRETAFVEAMFARDAKNYHVWSYRQWLVRRFELWDQGELEFTERMLARDLRNNSAWNHRWFVVNGRRGVEEGVKKGKGEDNAQSGSGKGEGDGPTTTTTTTTDLADPAILARELAFAQRAIRLTPQNQSPWNYLRALLRATGTPFAAVRPFAEEFARLEDADEVRSSFALDLLGEGYAEEGRREEARRCLGLLAGRYDPLRKRYWEWRRGMLGEEATAAAAA